MNWTKIAGIAAVVAVLVAVAAWQWPRGEGQSGKIDGAGQICQSKTGNVDCRQYPTEGIRSEEQAIESSRSHMNDPPPATGPWPFTVVNTGTQGLKVRSTNTVEGVQLGALPNLNTAWAECQTDSPFDPVPNDEGGAKWLRIKWDQQTQDDKNYYESQPDAKATGWIYRGLVVPLGHNGTIPQC